jgi:uncharacterized protein
MKKFVAWVEIPTVNFERAVKFYSTVFEMKLEGLDFGTEKMACFPSGEGAIIHASGYSPSTSGLVVSFNVPDSIEKTINRITENGGSVVKAKTKIEAEGRGYFAVCNDCEGNRIGLYGEI